MIRKQINVIFFQLKFIQSHRRDIYFFLNFE